MLLCAAQGLHEPYVLMCTVLTWCTTSRHVHVRMLHDFGKVVESISRHVVLLMYQQSKHCKQVQHVLAMIPPWLNESTRVCENVATCSTWSSSSSV